VEVLPWEGKEKKTPEGVREILSHKTNVLLYERERRKKKRGGVEQRGSEIVRGATKEDVFRVKKSELKKKCSLPPWDVGVR